MKLYFLILFSVLSVKSALALPCSYHFSELTKPQQRIVKTALSDLTSYSIPTGIPGDSFVYRQMQNILKTYEPKVAQAIIREALSPESISKVKDQNSAFVEDIAYSLGHHIEKTEGSSMRSFLGEMLTEEDSTISAFVKEILILGIEWVYKIQESETQLTLMELVKSEPPDSSVRKAAMGVLKRLENPSNEVAELMTQILGEKEWNDSRVVSKLAFSHPKELKKEIEKIFKTYKPKDAEKILFQALLDLHFPKVSSDSRQQVEFVKTLNKVDGGLRISMIFLNTEFAVFMNILDPKITHTHHPFLDSSIQFVVEKLTNKHD